MTDCSRPVSGMKVIGTAEHVWRRTRRGDKYVAVIIGLTPIRDKTGPARLLDMIEDRFEQVFKDWLQARPQAWRAEVEGCRHGWVHRLQDRSV